MTAETLLWIRFGVSALCTVLGLLVLITGVLGLFRFRYSLSRIHAAALNDTLGILLMTVGVGTAVGLSLTTVKLAVIVIFLWITGPVASHLIGRLEVTVDEDLAQDALIEDSAMVRTEKEGD